MYEKLCCSFLMPLCEMYVTAELGVPGQYMYLVRKIRCWHRATRTVACRYQGEKDKMTEWETKAGLNECFFLDPFQTAHRKCQSGKHMTYYEKLCCGFFKPSCEMYLTAEG